jgi:PAS domain S-box-containing protein
MEKVQILIVEDDTIIAMDLENQLKNLGYGVSAKVSYGKDAIQKAKENTPDLVLMDIVIKGEIDGIEAAEEIRTQFDIPVVFLTAFADKERIERAKLTMPFGYILKPFQDRDLKVTIEMALYVAKVDTKRKQAEHDLRESEEKYRSMMEAMPDAVYICSPDFRVEYMNPVMIKRTGRDATGDLCYKAINDLDERCPWCVYDKIQQGESAKIEIDSPKGNRYYNVSNSPIFHEDGSISKMTIYSDITEHKQAEAALRNSEERFRDLTEMLPESVFEFNRNLELTYANRCAFELFGYSAEDLKRGLNGLELIAPVDRDRATANVAGRLKGEDPGTVEYQALRKDGSSFPILFHASSIIKEGELSGLRGILLDITARKRAEEELRKHREHLEEIVEKRTADLTAANVQVKKELAVRKQAEKALIIAKQDAEAASEAKSLFINNMSHELRTPLSGIIVSADLALGQVLPPKAEKNLKTIRRSGRALLGTVTTILDFSKSESGKLELAEIPFRLDEVLGKLSVTVVQKGAQKQIKISFDIAADEVSNALIGDPDRLLEVFNHLLDNATKFSTGIQKAVIGVRDVDTSEKKTTLEFYVKDNGIGIASEDFEKIFDAFTQIDDSRTRQYDGTGMGLAVSKRLVERMGGTIRVESELDKGSTFYFTASFDRQDQEHPFKVPSFKDREDTTVKQMSSKTCGEMGSPEFLLELLLRIEPFIQKRKPKPCKEVMEEINGYSWPGEYTQDIAELGKFIGKYKFKDAHPILESIVEKLKSQIS